MDLATVLSIVQTVLTAIQTLDQLKDTFSFSHYKTELERLQKTVNTIQSVFEDADANQGALTHQQINYIEELKDAVYDANDVLDEFVTLVKQKEVVDASRKLSDKVRSFLSCFTPRSHNISDKVKDVNDKLDDIASNSSKFLFKVDNNKPIKYIKQETSSFVSVIDPIIGRDVDLGKIVKMLLNSGDVHQPNNVLSLAIVGMGGLGKTAFAQLVYNHPKITEAFELRSWTCIADQDQWNLTQLLGKISKELCEGNNHDLTSLEQIQHEIRKQLEGKKYLLVLDDVWTENYHRWHELEKFLIVGESGSRIVITTRSKKTAEIVGGARVHELQGLSEDASWRLFERMAFRVDQKENPDEDFVKLGKDIVKKCLNVPLAIRVVGSLLHGESKSKWLSFRDKELADISERDDTLKKILSLSYHQLDSSLKSCFSYCAIFPKDLKINKQMLISLWMAQGYINGEHVGEEYFRILLQRCFFQDVKENIVGDIKWFKIHDHLHDIAEQAAGKEVCRLMAGPFNVDRKVRHLYLLSGFRPQGTFNKTVIRTCLQDDEGAWTNSRSDQLLASNLIANWSSLRSLHLSYVTSETLPESIGKLLHLRYLDLSCSDLEVLPDSITKLVNLQTLHLYYCYSLKELPKDVCKLVDLSTLNITGCDSLSHMPSKMALLTKLHTLDLFVIGGASPYKKHCFDGLADLGLLKNLKGALQVRIVGDKNAKYVKEEHGGGAYFKNMVLLHKIHINFSNKADESIKWEEDLLEEMQPHTDIKVLYLEGYNGETIPRWPSRENDSTLFFFPNIVKLAIFDCKHLRCLPSLEKLPHLKKLRLENLPNVEYVVNINLEAPSLGEGISFFPSLELISIYELSKLKGWWPGSGDSSLELKSIHELSKLKGWWLGSGNQNKQLIGEPFPCFSQLKEIRIKKCPMLKSIPICSHLNSVHIYYSNKYVRMDRMDKLNSSYKCLIPSRSKSRMITISYFETFLPYKAKQKWDS